jgi:hypothetical protein
MLDTLFHSLQHRSVDLVDLPGIGEHDLQVVVVDKTLLVGWVDKLFKQCP